MNYSGAACPVCGENFYDGEDDIVVCPVCGTPHHRKCWNDNGGCRNGLKHSDGFVWRSQDASDFGARKDEKVKICPRCGERNAPYEPVCTRCGERLRANRHTIRDTFNELNEQFGNDFGDYTAPPNPNNFSPYQNVYAADARTVYGEEAQIDGIPVTEMAEYIQKDSNKYIGKFLTMQEKKTKLSWNWSAGLLSVFWCFYRRMTAAGIAVIALIFSSYLISSVVPAAIYKNYNPEVYAQYESDVEALNKDMQAAFTSGSSEDMSKYYSDFLTVMSSPVTVSSYIMLAALILIINIVFGFFGNYLYKRKIVKDILNIRQIAIDSMSYHLYIRQRGGVSVINIFLPIVLCMLLNMLTVYI